MQLMVNRERIVEVEWAGRPEKTAYAVKLLAVTENRTGMIAGITGAISDMKTGIRDARASVGSDEKGHVEDRKSTRLNSSHLVISYAVFCLKKKITHDVI